MLGKILRLMPIAGVLVPAAAAAQQEPGSYFHQHMWDGGWHGWFLGPLMMIVFIAVVLVVVVLLVRWLSGAGHGVPPHPPLQKNPTDILKQRFARGEIDKEEFEERRRILDD